MEKPQPAPPDQTAELLKAKEYWKTHHMQGTIIPPEGGEQDHRYQLARHILTHKPETVLEFGCSSGRNLKILKELALDSGMNPMLWGMDMNPTTIASARRAFTTINWLKGDERDLFNMADQSFDVVFTCSVLDHIPEPTWKAVYDQLVRLAKKAVVIYEPVYTDPTKQIYEGDLSKVRDDQFPSGLRVVPFTYSWDYFTHDPDLEWIRRIPIPTDAQDSGDYYLLMERKV